MHKNVQHEKVQLVLLEKKRVKEIALAKKLLKEKEEAKIVLAKKLAKEKEEAKIALAEELFNEKEEARITLAEMLAKEKEKSSIALAQKLAKEKKKKQLALLKKLAKEKKLRALIREKLRLENLKKESEEKQILTQLYKNEIEELENIDLIESDHPTDELILLAETKEENTGMEFKSFEKWFKYALGYSFSLKNLQEKDTGREAVKFTLMANPYSYFFAGTTFSLDLNRYENVYYQPDYSYSFGYSDWHQDTWSFGYANYANNKMNPKGEEKRFNFKDGTWEIGYKNKVDDVSLRANLKHTLSSSSTVLSLSASTTVAKKLLLSSKINHHFDYDQDQLVISAKTFIYDKFFISGSAYIYRHEDKQTDLEPDYAYSFGWKDSRPFHPSITYSNYYTPTRWGWKDKKGPHFEDGSISVNFNLKF